MRAELPWNVAGIPPEAREAARAAARREGLSVGEWLTRRILRSFSGMEDELSPAPYDTRAPSGASLDSWGLPPSAAARRDTEEMMARVGRSETESNDAWRRIDDQLRGLGRRLDSSERSHSESKTSLLRMADYYLAKNKFETAEAYFGKVYGQLKNTGEGNLLVFAIIGLGKTAMAQNKAQQALAYGYEALKYAKLRDTRLTLLYTNQ
ncbi:MAG: hypothetical protein EOP50_17560 [Sphingobacteriales bacterium]|nr:MAG: hypothetical protein EOP50_17560 [Sphingobacteriales bacterium]